MAPEMSTAQHSEVEVVRARSDARGQAGRRPLSTEQVWAEVAKASFAIVSYVTPCGNPRSSGIIYGLSGRHLYMAVDPQSWKARHITDGQEVAVTVPVRRGGPLSLLAPIPPATITFHARAITHPAGSVDLATVSKELESLVPKERRAASCSRTCPGGDIPDLRDRHVLMEMRHPETAMAHVPVG